VEQEEYEKAAELRDKIRAMKQELAAKEGGRENA
jgi:protein arginine kinase activator